MSRLLVSALLVAGCTSSGPGSTSATPDTDTDTDDGFDTDIEHVGSDCGEHPDVRLSEVVSANIQGLLDEDEDRPDWLELQNVDAEQVSTEGWALSDGGTTWRLPARTLSPDELLLVFASGKDRDDTELHAAFSIGGDETLSLVAPDGCVVDAVTPGPLPRDVAYGRTLEDLDTWSYFLDATPDAENTTEHRPGFADVPTISPAGGFSAEPVEVSVSGSGTLRYTIDATAPDDDSALYDEALTLEIPDELQVVRARAFVDGLWPSPVATATYSQDTAILDDDLAVISLVIDPFDLYDEETGIYAYGPPDYEPSYPYFGANFWEDWERDMHVEVWEPDGSQVLAQTAGVKIHGGYTRAFAQKNFRLIARSAYGPDMLEHAFFPTEEASEYKIVVLEGVGDWCPTHTENSFVDAVFRDEDDVRFPTIDTQAWEPAVLYLNGEFWGLYAFREKLDEHFIASHHGADPDNLDRIECTADGTDDWWRVSQGDWEAFEELEEFVDAHDLADDEAWATFKTMVDIDNLATAVLAEGYWGNSDWWDNNLKLWRERQDDAKWRWMVFDLGHGWPSASNDHIRTSVSWSGRGLPIAQALRNDEFRVLLANQGSDFLNTNLKADAALARLDTMHDRIRPVMAEQYALWCGYDVGYWEARVSTARSFVQQRDTVLWGQLQTHLGLAGTTTVTLEAEPEGAGSFHLEVVGVDAPFTGKFWRGIPVSVTAVPAEGYSFAGWADDLGEDETLTLTFDEAQTLTATFD